MDKQKRGRPKGQHNISRVDPVTGLIRAHKETGADFETRCNAVYQRILSESLVDRLAQCEFDVLQELITIYRTGTLNDRTKAELLLKLLDYIYPKKKAMEITQHTATKVEYVSTIVFEDQTKETYDANKD